MTALFRNTVRLRGFLGGITRAMKRGGDYLEVEGEQQAQEQKRIVGLAGGRFPVSKPIYAVHATRIR